MKPSVLNHLAGLALGVMLVGCAKQEIDISELEKAFEAIVPQEAVPAAAPTGAQRQEDRVRRIVDQAVWAIKTNGYVEAGATLQLLRSSPVLTGEQLTAVQDAMAAVQLRLAERADAGDPQAKRALEAIRRMPR